MNELESNKGSGGCGVGELPAPQPQVNTPHTFGVGSGLSPSDFLFMINTDESNYPVYITSSGEIWQKKRPNSISAVSAVFTIDISTTSLGSLSLSHELLDKAIDAVKEVTKFNADVSVFQISVEAYRGDYEQYLGKAVAHIIKVYNSVGFTFSVPFEKQAWAISFGWEKQIKAKFPELAKYTYAKISVGRRIKPRVIIKLPVVSREFEEMFNKALATAFIAQQTKSLELEEQIKSLEQAIKQKEQELEQLKQQLQQLLLKFQLEKLKEQVVKNE